MSEVYDDVARSLDTISSAIGYMRQLDTLRSEVASLLDTFGSDAVRVREGGGEENLAASLAVSVSKLLELRACYAREGLEAFIAKHFPDAMLVSRSDATPSPSAEITDATNRQWGIDRAFETIEAYGGGEGSAMPGAVSFLRKVIRDLEEERNRQGRYAVELFDECRKLKYEVETLRQQWNQAVNSPHTADFLESVRLEALHQRERWGVEHDAGKEDSDWFWLIGYLAGKALHKPEKQLHHIITTAAACLNWHAQKTGVSTLMRPGIEPPKS